MNSINASDLNKFLNELAKKTIKYVSEKALQELQFRIQKDVYEYDYYPNKRYNSKFPKTHQTPVGFSQGEDQSTYEFYNAFTLDKIKSTLNKYTQNLVYDWMGNITGKPMRVISTDSEDNDALHYWQPDGGDIRSKLVDLLNDENEYPNGRDADEKKRSKRRNHYWDNFIDVLTSDMQSWIGGYLKSQGLNFKITGQPLW